MPSIQLKTAVFAPIPRVRQTITTREKPGLRRSIRRPKEGSRVKFRTILDPPIKSSGWALETRTPYAAVHFFGHGCMSCMCLRNHPLQADPGLRITDMCSDSAIYVQKRTKVSLRHTRKLETPNYSSKPRGRFSQNGKPILQNVTDELAS